MYLSIHICFQGLLALYSLNGVKIKSMEVERQALKACFLDSSASGKDAECNSGDYFEKYPGIYLEGLRITKRALVQISRYLD